MATGKPTTIHETMRWIRRLEHDAFPRWMTEPPLKRDYVACCLRHATLLDMLMSQTTASYIDTVLEGTYEDGQWSDHVLKSFVMLDYPLVMLETVFRPELGPVIRNVQAGMYPFKAGREINACATTSPFGDRVIFFSEWLFAFLWEYFHVLFCNGSVEGERTESVDLLARFKGIETKFGVQLAKGVYHDWQITPGEKGRGESGSAKCHLLLALVFIWAHELGHILLGHLDSGVMKPKVWTATDGRKQDVPTYTLTQAQELDADMFASDVYFHFIDRAITVVGDEMSFRRVQLSGFDFFRMLARLELKTGLDGWEDWEHPPAGMRLVYMWLRHQQRFEALGFAQMFEELAEVFRKYDLPHYNHQKNVNSSALLS